MNRSIFGAYERLFRHETEEFLVSTIFAEDCVGYETAIAEFAVADGNARPIQWYPTLDEAKRGHAQWVAHMKIKYAIPHPVDTWENEGGTIYSS